MFQIRSSCNDAPSPRWSAIVERPRRQGRSSRIVALGLSAALSIGLSTSGHPIAIDGTVFSVDDQAPVDSARVHLGMLIQHCKNCDKLQHPPGPCCKYCQSFEWDTVAASGKGKLVSFVKMHHPDLPGFEKPNPVGLIELEEGN